MFLLAARLIFRRSSRFFATASSQSSNFSSDSPPIDSSVLWPRVPQTSEELIDFIKRNIIWVSDDYIASVKPYEIGLYGKRWNMLRRELKSKTDPKAEMPFDYWDDKDELDYDDAYSESDRILTVASIIPQLKQLYGDGKDLMIAKSVPRCYEGPLLLARSEEARDAVSESIRRAYSKDQPIVKTLNVCVGKPKTPQGEDWCYSKIEFINEVDGFRCTLHPSPPSKTKMRRNLMRQGFFRYRLLAYDAGADCSLVELEMKIMQHRLDRLFLLDLGCPVLGDTQQQMCNARILGQPVYVPPKRASLRNQYIPTGLLKHLRISLKEYHQLPLFAHVHTLAFSGLLKKSKKKREDVELRAPMPPYFAALLKSFDWLRVVKEDERRRNEEEENDSPTESQTVTRS